MKNPMDEKARTVLVNLKIKLAAENVMDTAHKAFFDSYANNLLNLLQSRQAALAASAACTAKINATNAFIADLDAMINEYTANGDG